LPYYTANFASRERLWLFREEEIEAALGITANYVHSFRQPGHKFEVNGSYTELKKEEYYYLDNITPNFTGNDKFDLYAEQKVSDLNIDYVKPLRYGRVEMGSKFRWRYLPINIDYFPGQ